MVRPLRSQLMGYYSMIKRDTRKDGLILKVVDVYKNGVLISSQACLFGFINFNNLRAKG